MRSKILPTLYSIVHGPRNKQKKNNESFKQNKLKQQSTCRTKEKKRAFSNLKIHTLICQNVHTITNLQNFHTYIQILQNSNRILDIIVLP